MSLKRSIVLSIFPSITSFKTSNGTLFGFTASLFFNWLLTSYFQFQNFWCEAKYWKNNMYCWWGHCMTWLGGLEFQDQIWSVTISSCYWHMCKQQWRIQRLWISMRLISQFKWTTSKEPIDMQQWAYLGEVG